MRPQSRYLERYAWSGPQIADPVPADLEQVVVIPCFNEPDLISSLESLLRCHPTTTPTEVIVVLNQPEQCSRPIREAKARTLQTFNQWKSENQRPWITFHMIEALALPQKHAGVGLARKIGMDEAVRRLELTVAPEKGIIICFDADSLCEPGYLVAIQNHFSNFPKTPGCSIYFEHPLSGSFQEAVYQAITDYELYLRYYVNGLKQARYPWAFHTIGSSMAVRSRVYQQQGGMNKRKAGEDFYFLHKIIPLGHYTNLVDTKVIPSPRPSDRVPFGTGKGVNEWLNNLRLEVYHPNVFDEAAALMDFIRECSATGHWPFTKISPYLEPFLKSQKFKTVLEESVKNTSNPHTLNQRLMHWLDGFTMLKFIHYLRDAHFGTVPVATGAAHLLDLPTEDPLKLLEIYRKMDSTRTS